MRGVNRDPLPEPLDDPFARMLAALADKDGDADRDLARAPVPCPC